MKKVRLYLFLISGIILAGAININAQTEVPLEAKIHNVEIIDCIFLKKLNTTKWVFTESEPEKYRYAVVTVKITKDAGQPLKVALADFTLHYRYGENKEEVAYCAAMSSFSTVLDVDRDLKASKNGPGWSKQSTGTRSTARAVVYVDLAFRKIENTVNDMWICVAQPKSSAFRSSGW